MSKKLNLFDWEDNQELGDNNLPEEGGIDVNNLNFEDYQQIKTYIPGQTQTFLYDRDKADRAFEAIEDSPRTSFHVGADDIDELIAVNQSTGEKWANGTAKLVGKTGVHMLGVFSMLGGAIGTTADWLVGGFEGEESWKDVSEKDSAYISWIAKNSEETHNVEKANKCLQAIAKKKADAMKAKGGA